MSAVCPTSFLTRISRLVALALCMLTRLPVRTSGIASEDELAWSVVFYPIVGALIGLCRGATALVLLSAGMGPLTAAALSGVLSLLITGGLHEDGLADTVDALGARDSRRSLEIMRDSSIGAWGCLAIASHLLIDAAAISELAATNLLPILVVAGALSRLSAVIHLCTSRCARTDDSSLASTMITQCKPRQLFLASALTIPIFFIIQPPYFLPIPCIAVATLSSVYCHNRFGGATGDTTGATVCICHTLILVFGIAL